MKRLLSIAVSATVFLCASPALATTIDFDELAHSGNATYFPGLQSGGFDFASDGLAGPINLTVWSTTQSENADPDGATLSNNWNFSTTTVSKVGGGLFDFLSIDLADVFNDGTGGSVLFKFTDGVGTTSQTVSLDHATGLQTFAFNRLGLTSFSYLPNSSPGAFIQVDNIVVDTAALIVGAAPEPATWVMLIGGFGLAGRSLRKRRRGKAFSARKSQG